MEYITTTDLRTKSSQLVDSLQKGSSVSLVHRSKVIGKIRPVTEDTVLSGEDIKDLLRMAKDLQLPKISYKAQAKIYRKELLSRYGKSISRH